MDNRLSEKAPAEYKHYLDVLRLLACFLVCYNHSFIFGVYISRPVDGSIRMWANILLSIPTSINVPLFFMISGALLLGREESYKILLCKRVFRFVVLLFAATGITWLVKRTEEITLKNYLNAVLSGNAQVTYWYLYAYLSYLLMLPFLRKIASQLHGRDVCMLVVLRGLFAAGLPIINFWVERWSGEALPITGQLSGGIACINMLYYPLLGWYFANGLPSERLGKKEMATCWTVLVIGTIVSAGMVYAQALYAAPTQEYLSLFGWSSAPAVFLIMRKWLEGRTLPIRLGRFLKTASSLTLGIYILEPVAHHYLRNAHYWNMKWEGPYENLEVGWYSVTWCLLCMSVCGLITWLLRKIPGVKKYL